jgi:hypothetical protein
VGIGSNQCLCTRPRSRTDLVTFFGLKNSEKMGNLGLAGHSAGVRVDKSIHELRNEADVG